MPISCSRSFNGSRAFSSTYPFPPLWGRGEGCRARKGPSATSLLDLFNVSYLDLEFFRNIILKFLNVIPCSLKERVYVLYLVLIIIIYFFIIREMPRKSALKFLSRFKVLRSYLYIEHSLLTKEKKKDVKCEKDEKKALLVASYISITDTVLDVSNDANLGLATELSN